MINRLTLYLVRPQAEVRSAMNFLSFNRVPSQHAAYLRLILLGLRHYYRFTQGNTVERFKLGDKITDLFIFDFMLDLCF